MKKPPGQGDLFGKSAEGGQARNTDPDTSAASAAKWKNKGIIRGRVLTLIEASGPRGLTIWEITLALGFDQRDSISPRIMEMRAEGPFRYDLIRDSGKRRSVVAHGKQKDLEVVWVATQFWQQGPLGLPTDAPAPVIAATKDE